MPPIIALIVCLIFSIYLLKRDSSINCSFSTALWIPVLWFLILGSHPISYWMHPGAYGDVGSAEGNWLDRSVDIILMICSMVVLYRRNVNFLDIARDNKFIIVFYLLCGISIIWSEFPLHSLKRWTKALGSLAVMMVILTESDQLGAIKTVLMRCAYVLLPLSVCLIKYYPSIGRGFSEWTGEPTNHGAAMDKNMLGKLCLVFGLIVISEHIFKKHLRKVTWIRNEFLVNVLTLWMTVWLLFKADSATSTVCLIIGVAIIYGSRLSIFRRNYRYIGLYISIGLLLFYIADLYFSLGETALNLLGREVTLTDRSELWSIVLGMVRNPWIGTGYESFWQGSRVLALREIFWWAPNQAHNGYIEVYLNLGIIGLFCLSALIISCYWKISRKMSDSYEFGVLSLSFFMVILFHNITEASFSGVQLLWDVFILFVIDMKGSTKKIGTPVYSMSKIE